MKNNRLTVALFILVGSLVASSVQAHSFNVIVIAPMDTKSSQSIRNGFLLATREQDAHEDETSDGHLGGLDSHVHSINTAAASMPDFVAQLEALTTRTAPLFAVGLDLNATTRQWLQGNKVVVIDPLSSGLWASIVDSGGQMVLFDGSPFSLAFARDYGIEPDQSATQAYVSARVIAAVVRNSDEKMRANPSELELAAKSLIEYPARLNLVR